jgi:SP family myo-inositol transporter-like MFS transporter 13
MNENHGAAKTGYNRFLLLVAGLGGLLYGVDVGIISGALPYLEATSGLGAGQLSFVVAAVLLGSVLSTLFAGLLSDWVGRKKMMSLSGILFVISIPIIALAHGYWPLIFGRLLQGISAGLIGVVIPLYLAECLSASNRGKGTGIFQWLLTLGIVAAALIGLYFSIRVDEIQKLGDADKLFAFKDTAWRGIFWISLPPGILFVIGSFMVAESPRWLFRRGKIDTARAALLRSRTDEQAETELKEMAETIAAEKARSAGARVKESLLRRKYVIPFILACIILACNQATGVNSVIAYNATILIQAGLSDFWAHLGYVFFTIVNFIATIGAVVLVDRKGRKFLLSLGTGGVIVSMVCVGLLFHKTEKLRVDMKDAVQSRVATNQTLTLAFNQNTATKLLAEPPANASALQHFNASTPFSLVIIYSYGDFSAATPATRSDATAAPIELSTTNSLPGK